MTRVVAAPTVSSPLEKQVPERCGCGPKWRRRAPHDQKVPRPAGAREPRDHDPPIACQDRVPRN